MTPEARVVRAVVRVLDEHHAVHWNHAAAGDTGIPDRFAVHHGRLLALEIKRPRGGRVSPKQRWWLDRLAAAGAIALVVTDAEQVRAVLHRIEASQSVGAHLDHARSARQGRSGMAAGRQEPS